MGELVDAIDATINALVAFDAALVEPAACAELVGLLARAEKLCRLRKVQAAQRATSGSRHGHDGAPDAAAWLAGQSGESVGASKADLATAAALGQCPATAEAASQGEISLDQAKEIAAAEAENPGSEEELLPLARRAPLSRLRDESRRKRQEAIKPEDLHAKQRAARRFRAWTNELGNIAFSGELTPEVGIPLVNRLQAETDRKWREAKRLAAGDGSLEAREAYAADAFVEMTSGRGRGRAKSADVVIVIDLRAWRRGRAEGDEVCRIVGGSNVPVSVAKELAVDAFFKAVIHDGENILTIAHLGRKMSAELQTALDLGPPPLFNGITCCEAGCDRRHGLQWDHVDPVANRGPTSYDNLKPRCWPHHQEKTDRDRAAGLLGPRARSRAATR